jgi:hypothetical protein
MEKECKSSPGDAGNRITGARQEGCVIAYCEVCLDRMIASASDPSGERHGEIGVAPIEPHAALIA